MLSYAKSAPARSAEWIRNGETQLFNSWGVVKWAYYFNKNVACCFNNTSRNLPAFLRGSTCAVCRLDINMRFDWGEHFPSAAPKQAHSLNQSRTVFESVQWVSSNESIQNWLTELKHVHTVSHDLLKTYAGKYSAASYWFIKNIRR